MRTLATLFVIVIIGFALFAGCASTGTSQRTTIAPQQDQGSYDQDVDRLITESML